MSNISGMSLLPAAMEGKLRSIRRHLAGLAIVQSLALGGAVLILAMLVAMGIDWIFTLFDTRIRLALTTASLVAAISVAVRVGFRPLCDACGWTAAAASADDVVPQLEERWATVASFANSARRPVSGTARAMLEQVTSEAVSLERLVRPGMVSRPATVRPAVTMFGASLLVMLVFLASDWPQTSVLWQRFWSPTAHITATQLVCVTGDRDVPRGETVKLVVTQSGVQRSAARMEIASREGVLDVFEVPHSSEREGAFVYALAVDQAFRYRMLAGDGRTPWHDIAMIDYPELAEVQLTITPPEYVDRPPYEKTLIPGRVRVVQGSQLSLRMKPSEAVTQFEMHLTIPGETESSAPVERVVVLTPDREGWYLFETQLIEDFAFSPHLRNRHDLTNEDKTICRIQVVADKAPVARIISPNDELAVAKDEVIDIEFEAHDDHGIAAAELVVYDESQRDEQGMPKEIEVRDIPLGDKQLERHLMGKTQLDLKELDLKEGAQISYAIRVKDNRDLTIDPEKKLAQMGEARPGQPASDQPDSSDVPGDGEGKPSEADPENMLLADAREQMDARKPSDSSIAEDEATRSPTGSRQPTPGNPTEENPSTADSSALPNTGESAQNKKSSLADSEQGTDPSDSQRTAMVKSKSNDSKSSDAEPNSQSPGKNAEGMPEDSSETPKPGSPRENAVSNAEETPRGTPNLNPGKNADQGTKPDASEPPGAPPSRERGDTPASKENSETTPPTGKQDDPNTDGVPKPSSGKESPEDSSSGSSGKSSTTPREIPQDREGKPIEGALVGKGDDKPQVSQEDTPQDRDEESSAGAGGGSKSKRSNPSSEQGVPRNQLLRMTAQRGGSQQDVETGRRTLRITERLLAIASARDQSAEKMAIRDRVLEIDRRLMGVETALVRILERNLPDADRSEAFQQLDSQLGDIETYIADLRNETADKQFAFVGLQMVHIGTSQVTPARNRVFAAIREPLGTDNPQVAMHHVVRAREMLDALLKRYDRVAREQQLAEKLDESVKMYEVYVEKMQSLMREARENRNPLRRSMAVIEVDQEYLDRYAEVLKLRREMLSEFGRMLGDDPRLLARYLELLRRRRNSLRHDLSELAERQREISTELNGWQQVQDAQRDELWSIVAELRLHAATPLAREADGLYERISQTMPLVLAEDEGTAKRVISEAEAITRIAREISFDAKKAFNAIIDPQAELNLSASAEALRFRFRELDALLDQLNFENEDSEEVTSYVSARLLESRVVADMADAWAQVANFLQQREYHGLAEIDQQRVAIATEVLRIEMQSIETDLEGQFQQVAETSIPGEIVDMIRELHRVMESITFNQQAATFAMTGNQLDIAEAQQTRAVEGFDRAEELFDAMRRAVIAALDQYKVDDPNIADLRDPTLDAFLAQLEREPDIEAQLGIPNRPRNLRVLAETMEWQQTGGDMLGESSDEARKRAKDAMQMNPKSTRIAATDKQSPDREKPESELTDEERKELEKARQMQETLEKSLVAIQQKLEDQQTTPEQRRQLEQMAQKMRETLEQNGARHSPTEEWERIVEADQARELLAALAAGKRLPDDQWNKLLSKLDEGLWQVRGKTPPEDYRTAIEQYQERLRKLMENAGVSGE